MTRLLNILGVLAIATLLAGGGFVGYLFGTHRLNPERMAAMAAVLRGELTLSTAQAATTQPASSERSDAPAAGRSADEVHRAQEQERLHRALWERAAEDAQARQRLAEQALQHLLSEQEAFARQKTVWLEQQKKLQAEARDSGFERELEYVGKLQPKVAKEHILRTWRKHKADAVRLFMKLNPSTGKAILEQCRTPDEIQFVHELLEQVRLQDIDGSVPKSGRTEGDASD